MYNIIKKILYRLLKFFTFLYTLNYLFKIRVIKNLVYSGFITKKLKYSGNNIYLEDGSDISGLEYISISENFQSFRRLRLEAISKYNNQYFNPEIIIGKNVSINYDCHIASINKIIIGDNALIGSKVLIIDHSHGVLRDCEENIPPSKRILYSKGPIIIGKNVWIGEGVAILSGVVIGDGVVIGANSVVTKDIPGNAIAGGNPCKIIKRYEDG